MALTMFRSEQFLSQNFMNEQKDLDFQLEF